MSKYDYGVLVLPTIPLALGMETNLFHSLSQFFKITKNSKIRVLWIGDRRHRFVEEHQPILNNENCKLTLNNVVNQLFIPQSSKFSRKKRKAWFFMQARKECGSEFLECGSEFLECV